MTGILNKNNLWFIFLSLLKACRPIQWTKNLLVFAVILFSFKLNKLILLNSSYAFISFCFISSAIYLINDIRDIQKDKLHPKKRNRPIPKGDISVNIAKFSSIFFATLGLLIGYVISLKFVLMVTLYGTIQILYCIRLKKEPLLDIICIASGFLLRAISGVIASGLNFSPWFILTIGLLALFLAVEKRKAELIFYKETSILTRETLEKYSLPLLQRYESLLSTSTFISYSLWAAGPSLNGASSPWMLLSIPFVLLGIFRYLFIGDPEISKNLTSKKISLSTENPELILIYDSGIRNLIIFWILTIVLVGIFFH